MQKVMKIQGTAKNVFKYIELMNKYQGKTTLKDLANRKGVNIDLR
jgi:hypothetical protein